MRRWLRSTRSFQAEAFKTNVSALEGVELADYLHYNLTAAMVEMGELAQEIGWKPWDTRRGWFHRKRVIEEGVDVLMFVGNILAACGVSDREIARELRRKRGTVLRRQKSGTYTSRKRSTT